MKIFEVAIRDLLKEYPQLPLVAAVNCLEKNWSAPPPKDDPYYYGLMVDWLHENLPEVHNHLALNKKIYAIKAVREATGWSLLGAKNVVELYHKNPGYFPNTQQTPPPVVSQTGWGVDITNPVEFAAWVYKNNAVAVSYAKQHAMGQPIGKILAIKEIRSATGCSLKQAVAAYEVLKQVNMVKEPGWNEW